MYREEERVHWLDIHLMVLQGIQFLLTDSRRLLEELAERLVVEHPDTSQEELKLKYMIGWKFEFTT